MIRKIIQIDEEKCNGCGVCAGVTIVRMEVPCCGRLECAAKAAIQASGKFIPWQVAVVTTDGTVINES